MKYLWNSFKAVLGKIADDYSKPIPAENASITFPDSIWFGDAEFAAIETSAYAPHHLSFLRGNNLFIGETAE